MKNVPAHLQKLKSSLCLLTVIGFFFVIPLSRHVYAGWYSQGWLYRKSITIDNTQVPGINNFTNFTLLVNIPADTDLRDNAQADGDDILFTSSDGITKLDHQIERFVGGTGQLVAWVQIPIVEATNDTTIYMYYGNPTISSQQNRTSTWAAEYVGIYHMSEDPSTTNDGHCNSSTYEVCDSTSLNLHADSAGSMMSGDLVQDLINGAINFDGTDDVVFVADNANHNFSGGSFTYQTWFRMDQLPSDAGHNFVIANKANDSGDANARGWQVQIRSNDDFLQARIWPSTGEADAIDIRSNAALSATTWYHLAMVYDDSTDDMTLYLNGAAQTSNIIHNTEIATDYAAELAMGNYNSTAAGSVDFDGRIDEARLLSTALAGDWIAAEYNNQNDPEAFYTLGSQQTQVFQQSAYRWYENDDSTDVGDPLGPQDARVTLTTAGVSFRLRMLLHVAGLSLGIEDTDFKLQYAVKSGTCDTSFAGETYADVTTTTPIAFYNNPTPGDEAAAAANGNDPIHSGHSVTHQTYEEANNFTTTSSIPAGEDGLWDFVLYDYSAFGSESYCFRIVKANGEELNTYSVIPEIEIPVSLSFTIAGVGANTINNGITTSAASTATTLPFGNLLVNSPKYLAHALSVSTNAQSGYSVTMRLSTDTLYLQGLYPGNIIDPFAADGVSWSTPVTWSSPNGTVSNVNTGWFGANTSDTRVPGWSDAAQKFGPVSTNSNIVMQSSTADTDALVYVTYGLEVNVKQPTDQYAGQLVYTITPNY